MNPFAPDSGLRPMTVSTDTLGGFWASFDYHGFDADQMLERNHRLLMAKAFFAAQGWIQTAVSVVCIDAFVLFAIWKLLAPRRSSP